MEDIIETLILLKEQVTERELKIRVKRLDKSKVAAALVVLAVVVQYLSSVCKFDSAAQPPRMESFMQEHDDQIAQDLAFTRTPSSQGRSRVSQT